MDLKQIIREIKENITTIIAEDSALGKSLWQELLKIHPADLAVFVSSLDESERTGVYTKLPKDLKLAVFEELSDFMKVQVLTFMSQDDRIDALNILTADELTDLFDLFSDDELKKYLDLLHQTARQEVINLLRFNAESAGGIMDINVLTLMDDFTVEKSTKILQRLRPRREIHQQIYVTDRWHRLIGHILLEDLVLQNPEGRIADFLRKNELIATAHQDREEIARKMIHYGLMTVPVVGDDNYFLGVIPAETLVDVIVEEASEDVQKMSALTPIKHSYFETSFWKMVYERTIILTPLLIAESFSRTILNTYEATLTKSLLIFIPMIISTGGNTSNQTSALVIQGIASGDIHLGNMYRFLKKELSMGFMLASILAMTTFARVYWASEGIIADSLTISLTLFISVFLSIALASAIPFILKRFKIDPAFAAGPFLATVMDVLGIFVLCMLSRLILS